MKMKMKMNGRRSILRLCLRVSVCDFVIMNCDYKYDKDEHECRTMIANANECQLVMHTLYSIINMYLMNALTQF